ncbi:MAG: methyltransferase domain-containing protein [Candidatus Nealsonbacteria bacterium]
MTRLSDDNHYNFFRYNYQTRWISYWHQISEILKLNSNTLLEIGVGDKTVSDYLKNKGVQVVTADIDKSLEPDVVGSVLKLPFPDNSFDAVLCAEVLEHLPFEDFSKALQEIRRVSNQYAVLSLPQWGWVFHLSIKIPLFPLVELFFKISGLLKIKAGGRHYWEIGRRGYPLKKIKKIIADAGFEIIRDYINSASPYHHFFILRK